jgi:hypothetical protein
MKRINDIVIYKDSRYFSDHFIVIRNIVAGILLLESLPVVN